MNGAISSDQVIIRNLTEIIHANLENENFGVNELAIAAGMSRSTIHRRLNSLLKKSSSQFIREVRLQKAMEMLHHDLANISEISYKVGFNSPTYFNTCFHQYFGYPPGEVKRRISSSPEQNNGRIITQPGTAEGGSILVKLHPKRLVPYTHWSVYGAAAVILVLVSLTYLMYVLFIKDGMVINANRLKVHEKSIAVLPFKNLSGNRENQYFADGVMEDILNHLSGIKELKVKSSTTVEHYRGKTMTAPEIARKLGVNFILEGSVQQYEGKVRINVQLIDARHDQHIWSEKYYRELSDIFIIQSIIAKQVADELEAVLSSNEIQNIEKIPTKNAEAYNMYLKGHFYRNMRTEEGVKKSMEYFGMAIANDPDYVLAYAGLADAYYIQARRGWILQAEGTAKAKAFTRRALELDQNLAEAHATKGALLCWSDWKWEEAQKEMILAIELKPHYAIAHQYYSEFLDIIGKNDKARVHINLALELDQFSPEMCLLSALYYYHEGKFEASLEECRKAEKLDPDFISIFWRYFHIYFWQGEDIKAVEALHKMMTLDTLTMKNADAVKEVYNKSKINGLLTWMTKLEHTKAEPQLLTLARLYAMQGNKKEALAWLGKAFDKRLPEIPGINNDPDFESLRSDPRFIEILKQMGLSAYN